VAARGIPPHPLPGLPSPAMVGGRPTRRLIGNYVDIITALRDPNLFGALPRYRDLTTWRAWLALLRALYGLPMDAADLDLFRRFTGRQSPRPGGYPEAVVITGRQSGKTQTAGIVACFETVARGKRGEHVVMVAQDARSATRALFGYAREVFDLPLLRAEVTRETADTVELASGAALSVYPCRPAAVRGIRASFVVLDELAFMLSGEGNPVDREMVRAVRPTLATTGGKLLMISSPYAQSGVVHDLHRQHYGREESPVLVWQAAAPDMNPLLPADYLERMRVEDPEAYRSEVLGEFRAGLSSLLDPAALDAVIDAGRRESPREPHRLYRAHFDASGGRGDAAALAIGHREPGRDGVVVLDAARRWPAPHSPQTVIAEAAAVMCDYGVRRVAVDRYGGQFPVGEFARHGIRAEVATSTTSEHHLALVPLVNAGRVRLLDLPELRRELAGLERRAGSGGRDRVDHRPGAHDDLAAAVSGVVAALARRVAGDTGVTLGEPAVSAVTQGASNERAIFTADPSSSDYWPAAWDQNDPETWA
jgi:hypothetical protein